MVRLRPTRAVRVLTFEEKKRVANFFMLLIEVNLQKKVTNKRRSHKSTKNKKLQCSTRKTKCKPVKQKPCYSKCPALSNSSRTAQRDLFLQAFIRIFKCNIITFTIGYCNDRYHYFTAC
jgi:hypothetical protein